MATVATNTPMTQGIHHIGICVPDLSASVRWYCECLGAESLSEFVVEEPALGVAVGLPGARLRGAMLRWRKTGIDTMVELLQYDRPQPKPFDQSIAMCDHGITHAAFWTVNSMWRLYETLTARGVWFYSSPQTLKLPGQTVLMCYFKDLNGISLELIGT